MKISGIALFLFSISAAVHGQNILTVTECYERAGANYPLIKQRALIDKTRAYSLENASTGHLPRISLGGQATYQSDVTQIPVEMPGVEPLNKDQYRIFAEVSQDLYHGGTVRQQKRAEEVSAAIEAEKLEVEMYQLRQRINELFFGILLLREQVAQSQLLKEDLSSAMRKLQAGIRYGTALRSAGDVLQAELLRLDQRIIELQSTETSFRDMLAMFIGGAVESNMVLAKPLWPGKSDVIARPELKLFGLQKRGIETNRALLSARKKPRIELFLQGGYGRPALNMLENSFDFYYVAGVRLNWLLSGYYTAKREYELLDLRQLSLDVQQETFLFNTNLTLSRDEAEIAKLQQLMQVDDEIISLRTRVMRTAEAQLEEGLISATDYVREVNAADQAKQNRALHEMQLLMAQAKYSFTTGQQQER